MTEARAAVRGLPVREAPSGFWDAVLSRGAEERPVERSRRWQVLAPIAATAAAAAVLVAVLLPGRETVTPAVPALVDAHAAEASVAADPISRLAPIGVPVGLGR
ncbi:MAG: hypothetical protein M5U14_14340 [Acidimicrobiia bacterium]|nr:hypothetical protein [Acidimicrobiia bacterium]